MSRFIFSGTKEIVEAYKVEGILSVYSSGKKEYLPHWITEFLKSEAFHVCDTHVVVRVTGELDPRTWIIKTGDLFSYIKDEHFVTQFTRESGKPIYSEDEEETIE